MHGLRCSCQLAYLRARLTLVDEGRQTTRFQIRRMAESGSTKRPHLTLDNRESHQRVSFCFGRPNTRCARRGGTGVALAEP